MSEVTSLSSLVTLAAKVPALPAAIIHPVTPVTLLSAMRARELGLITPVLIGPRPKLEAAAAEAELALDGVETLFVEHSHAAVEAATRLVREGRVGLLVKGSLATDELMSVILQDDSGMRTGRRMSHVFAMEVASYRKLLLITDAAINVVPDLLAKRDIVQNAIELAHALGIALPKVAILSAQEKVKPQLPSTIDAAALCKMADREQITGGLLDGPLAFDNAISLEAAQSKGIRSAVAGDADILVTPDLEAGNMLAKQLSYLANAKTSGIVLGGRVPIALTSRAEKLEGRLFSIALGVLMARHKATAPL